MLRPAEYWRDRALDCLNIAKSVRDEVDKSILEDIAAELLDEAKQNADCEGNFRAAN